MKWVCESEPNLDVKQGQSSKILHKDGLAFGVETTMEVQYTAKAIVITTGTFLRGLMHIGSNQQSGGRAGDAAAMSLSTSLKELGLELGRLKTGTPPRLLRSSIDFSKLEIQQGDEPVPYFTFWKDDLFHMEHSRTKPIGAGLSGGKYPAGSVLDRLNGQLPCFITFTTENTAKIIRQNLHKSPLYAGIIEGVGPRYCPSIEDKIVKFPEKERHQIFLEPEGIETDEFYVNGFSTSLPFDVQFELVRTIIGCENAEILRPAYAVEYDFAYPTQLHPTLETKVCRNLFLAGQINGTSGYEEAGAQGLMAGINAARRTKGSDSIVIRRDQAYIGVLIDDLITKGTAEPYRMFTSRAEYRLLLRQDNADLRLSQMGHDIGLLRDHNYRKYLAKEESINNEISRLYKTYYESDSIAKILSRPEISYKDLPKRNAELTDEVVQQVEITIKYAGYIARQELEVKKFKTLEDKGIPETFDFSTVPSLRLEARQKLGKIRPATIGQAARISGVSPADISILMVCLKRWGANGSKDLELKEEDCNACETDIEE
jgi:tRNA uridine 5-carboxymethylaminomethyl modification enzyme